MSTTRGRIAYNNLVVYSQVEFFQVDGYTRIPGLTPLQLVLEVYHNNTVLSWPLQVGGGVTDTQVASGQVYLDSLPTGSYGIRWRPNATGYWRLMLFYPTGLQIQVQDYDVCSGTGVASTCSGLKVSFVGPAGKDDC